MKRAVAPRWQPETLLPLPWIPFVRKLYPAAQRMQLRPCCYLQVDTELNMPCPISKQIPGASSTQRIFLSVLFSVPCACIKNKSCESSALGGWEPRKGTCNNPRAFCNSAIASLNFASTLFFGAAFFFLKTSSSHAVCP